MSILALLDFSSVFDTSDQSILVHHLHIDFEFTDTVFQWFSSYVTGCMQYICLSNYCSAIAHMHSCVHHGSFPGPMLLSMYMKPLSTIIDSHYHLPFNC